MSASVSKTTDHGYVVWVNGGAVIYGEDKSGAYAELRRQNNLNRLAKEIQINARKIKRYNDEIRALQQKSAIINSKIHDIINAGAAEWRRTENEYAAWLRENNL